MIVFPTDVDPVNPNLRTSGWSDNVWPTRDPKKIRFFLLLLLSFFLIIIKVFLLLLLLQFYLTF